MKISHRLVHKFKVLLRRIVTTVKMELLFAWLQNFGRFVVRYEYHDFNFDGLIALGYYAQVFLK
ncbi:hypothetical protein LEP1GSC039_3905 [Leptospira santarosai str. 2000027870]|nr:hypothetical protein LEP1GSC039_3905 [Leptospira santarosai str. 2000027870]